MCALASSLKRLHHACRHRPGCARMRGVTDDDATTSDDELSTGPYALWVWIAVLIVMFMGVVVVIAIIQTNAQ